MDENRWLAGRMIETLEKRDAVRKAARWRGLVPRETMATLMLGSSSVALAGVMLLVTSLGFTGVGFPTWSEPREWLVEGQGTQWDPSTKMSVPVLVSAGTVYMPSRECDLLAFVGLVLGGIGIGLSVRRRRFSWLSAIGFSVTLGMMAIVVVRGAMSTIVR